MIKITGRVETVLIAPLPDSLVSEIRSEALVDFSGFVGDRHAGLTMHSNSRTPQYPRGTEIRNSRQVSIVSTEELALIAQKMGLDQIMPQWIGANLCLSGVPALSLLPPGARLFFADGVTLVNEGENKPCLLAGKSIESQFEGQTGLAEQFPKLGMGLRGIVAWVEKPGRIRQGEEMIVQIPERNPSPSLK